MDFVTKGLGSCCKYYFDKVGSGGKRFFFSSPHNLGSYFSRVFFFAESSQDELNGMLVPGVEDVCGGGPRLAHAHVEWFVSLEAESSWLSASWRDERVPRESEVEEDSSWFQVFQELI